ncbi:MAG: S-layer homology domain-containing protein [Clostridiales bacterium]|nr:S-layer homology domain-containing protein [Clostridiales bacterium]
MAFKKAMVVMIILSLITCSVGFASGFSDIGQVSWAQSAISFMSQKGFVGGYSDGTFKPNQKITRAEIVTIINKMNGFEETGEIVFSDVNSKDWFYKEIQKATQAGYVTGFPNGKFEPNAFVTREQVAVIIGNLYKIEDSTESLIIEDIDQISNWAKSAVERIIKSGIMSGYPDGSFRGRNNITRAEAAVVLSKIHQKFSGVDIEQEEVIEPQIPVDEAVKPTPTEPEGDKVVNDTLEIVLGKLESRVLPKLTTTLQRDAANTVMDSISKYLSNPSYDFDSDVASAKSLVAQMTDEEQLAFENAITSSIPISELNTLNQKFRLINY